MSKNKSDACGRRIRPNHHELELRDPMTGQLLGRYHVSVSGTCSAVGEKYMQAGSIVAADIIHPTRCGDEFTTCDAGLHDSSPAGAA